MIYFLILPFKEAHEIDRISHFKLQFTNFHTLMMSNNVNSDSRFNARKRMEN